MAVGPSLHLLQEVSLMAIVGGKIIGDQAGRESSSLEKQRSQELWSAPVTSNGGRATTTERADGCGHVRTM